RARRSKLNVNFEYRFGAEKEWRIVIANTRELREKVFRLVHDVYLKEGYELRYGRESGLWCTIHHLHPGTMMFLAEREGRGAGSVTVMPDSPLGLPTDRIFPEPLTALRKAGRRMSEISSLVVTEEPRGIPPELAMHLYRLAHLAGVHVLGSTDLIASVMAHHGDFYSRFLLFDEVSPEPRLSPKTGQRVTYARLDLETMKERYRDRYERVSGRRNLYRWFFQNEDEPAILGWLRDGRRPMTTDELYYFGAKRTNILARAGHEVIALLEAEYRKAGASET
ncbi:MAG: hypothetical protein MUF17_04025, partial [Syntrophales bacterium]|nr:hypothetical protein [Syntrophales bacterium]